MNDNDAFNDEQILRSWGQNARAWSEAIAQRSIASRLLATDAAILQTVLSLQAERVLDLGCGEGWLTRALEQRGVTTTGIDAVPELIETARRLGAGDYRLCGYEEIARAGKDRLVTALFDKEGEAPGFDAIVCNFSLLGKDAVDSLLAALPALLRSQGMLVIQTLHPLESCGDHPYRSGWRPGSWAGFGPQFADPAPWYFRTLEDWLLLLRRTGWQLNSLREPLHPHTNRPASLLLVAQIAAGRCAGE